MNNIEKETGNIGILGGTFNPVHCGHLNMAKVALECGIVSCVAFLPLSIAPHKNNYFIADKEDRYNMLLLAIKDNPKFSVWRDEIDREGYTYTIDTLNIIKAKYPYKKFTYIIGSDTLFTMCNWRKIAEIFKACDFLVIYRPGMELRAVIEKAKEYEEIYGAKIHVIKGKSNKAASSAIRVSLSNGDNAENLLPKIVYKYIIEHNLYGV